VARGTQAIDQLACGLRTTDRGDSDCPGRELRRKPAWHLVLPHLVLPVIGVGCKAQCAGPKGYESSRAQRSALMKIVFRLAPIERIVTATDYKSSLHKNTAFSEKNGNPSLAARSARDCDQSRAKRLLELSQLFLQTGDRLFQRRDLNA